MRRILVGTATCGVAAGALKVLEVLQECASEPGSNLVVSQVGCAGLCYSEPLVEVQENGSFRLYGRVTPAVARAIGKGEEVDPAHLLHEGPMEDRDSMFPGQKRVVLRRCGVVDPTSLDDYLATGGYVALKKVLSSMTPSEVIKTITDSGLRGRGGGGFPTGRKWQFVAAQANVPKYVICNADEGDPGAFMDRSVLEGDPFSVLEGMAICGYATGSAKGIIYCRAEYPRALARLRNAIALCKERNLLGESILGSNFSFDVKVKEGAGAFVCGEETALIRSIEGGRGMPRFRPPFPAISGLYGKPTNINNVETFANVPWIIVNGAEAFSSMGTAGSKGTKVFALAGKVRRGGLVEVPMGTTINQLVFDIGGGVPEGRSFKAVQIGGPSGGCIPSWLGDVSIDYENVVQTGAIMGSGGIIVMDDSTCMVDVAKYFLSFTQTESCGKCTFCRIGTLRMLEILERITAGKGEPEDIDRLLDLGEKIKQSSLCGLGQTAPNPVLTTLRYFKDEYEAHIREKRCPALSCNALVSYYIEPERCTGCGACKKSCPVSAISGEPKKVHVINEDACIRCGRCAASCAFEAIAKR